MTFQRQTGHRIIDLARALKPDVKIVMGGYDPSLAPNAYEEMEVDYMVRGGGEVTFRELSTCTRKGHRVRRYLRPVASRRQPLAP